MEQQKKEFTGSTVEIENKIFNKLIDIIGNDTNIKINTIKYYEDSFGGIVVWLKTKANFQILFELDRGYLNCDIESLAGPTQRAGLREVLEYIGHKPIPKFVDFFDMLTSALKVIKQNWPEITEAFDENHVSTTISKIEAMSFIRRKEINHIE